MQHRSLSARPLFFLSLLALARASLACSAPVSDGARTGHTALEASDPTETDEDLKWVKDNGFSGLLFATSCASKIDGGDTIDAEPLPVGGGRWLDCRTDKSVTRQTSSALSTTGEHWCALGEVATAKPNGDPRLVVTIAASPEGAPWSLRGTHDGDPIAIARVEFGGFGMTWPLWVEANYRTVDMRREENGKTCDELFGL
jgi:hypothetical protein